MAHGQRLGFGLGLGLRVGVGASGGGGAGADGVPMLRRRDSNSLETEEEKAVLDAVLARRADSDARLFFFSLSLCVENNRRPGARRMLLLLLLWGFKLLV